MNPVIMPGAAADDDRAALLVDAGPGADVTTDHQVAAAEGGTGQRARVLVDHDHAGHHVLGHRPPDAAGDPDLRPVDQAAAEVAEAALDSDPAAGENANGDGVLRARVEDRDVRDFLVVDQTAELELIWRVERSAASNTALRPLPSPSIVATSGASASGSARPRAS